MEHRIVCGKVGLRRFIGRSVALLAPALMLGMATQALAAPGDALGAPQLVRPGEAYFINPPAVARAANGDFVVVRFDTCNCATLYYADGTPKGAAFTITDTTAYQPRVAMDAAGNFAVSWRNSLGGRNDPAVLMRRFDATGTALGAEVRVSEPLQGNGFPVIESSSIAMNASGDIVVVWDQGRPLVVGSESTCGYGTPCVLYNNYSVRARRYDRSGTASPIDVVARVDGLSINLLVTGVNDDPRLRSVDVAMADDGRYVVAWARAESQRLKPGSGVYTRSYAANGTPTSLVRVLARPLQGIAMTPAVGIDAAGNYAVAYRVQISTRTLYQNDIYLRQVKAGGTAAAAQHLAGTDVYGAERLGLAMTPAGQHVVVWEQISPQYQQALVGQRFGAGGGALAAPFVITQGSGENDPRTRSDVASDTAGNFVVVWDAGASGAYLQRYEGP